LKYGAEKQDAGFLLEACRNDVLLISLINFASICVYLRSFAFSFSFILYKK